MNEVKTTIPLVPYSEKPNQPLYYLRERAISLEKGQITYPEFLRTATIVSDAPRTFFKIGSDEYKEMSNAFIAICTAVEEIQKQRDASMQLGDNQ